MNNLFSSTVRGCESSVYKWHQRWCQRLGGNCKRGYNEERWDRSTWSSRTCWCRRLCWAQRGWGTTDGTNRSPTCLGKCTPSSWWLNLRQQKQWWRSPSQRLQMCCWGPVTPQWGCTHRGCRDWGRRSRRRSRCGVHTATCCWRCGRSWTPGGKCNRWAGKWPEARWRSLAILPESALRSPVSTGNTCRKKVHRRFTEELYTHTEHY